MKSHRIDRIRVDDKDICGECRQPVKWFGDNDLGRWEHEDKMTELKTKWIEMDGTDFEGSPRRAMVQICIECGHGPGYHSKKFSGCTSEGWHTNGQLVCQCTAMKDQAGEWTETTDENGDSFTCECSECEAKFIDTSDAQPLYECSSCGSIFTEENSADGGSNRCPDCNKFAAKISDLGCPECGQGEIEEIKQTE